MLSAPIAMPCATEGTVPVKPCVSNNALVVGTGNGTGEVHNVIQLEQARTIVQLLRHTRMIVSYACIALYYLSSANTRCNPRCNIMQHNASVITGTG